MTTPSNYISIKLAGDISPVADGSDEEKVFSTDEFTDAYHAFVAARNYLAAAEARFLVANEDRYNFAVAQSAKATRDAALAAEAKQRAASQARAEAAAQAAAEAQVQAEADAAAAAAAAAAANENPA